MNYDSVRSFGSPERVRSARKHKPSGNSPKTSCHYRKALRTSEFCVDSNFEVRSDMAHWNRGSETQTGQTNQRDFRWLRGWPLSPLRRESHPPHPNQNFPRISSGHREFCPCLPKKCHFATNNQFFETKRVFSPQQFWNLHPTAPVTRNRAHPPSNSWLIPSSRVPTRPDRAKIRSLVISDPENPNLPRDQFDKPRKQVILFEL